MITIICGEPGKGKTALMTYFAVQRMVYEGFERWWNCCKKIDILRAGGFSQLEYLPQRHTVYADYVITNRFPLIQSYYVDGFKLSLPNPFFETAFIAPFSTIFLDEAQKYYDSRMSKYLRECVYRFYQLHRHNHLDVFMTCQRLGNIDLNIRQIAERIILVEDLKIQKDDWGYIKKMEWIVKEFNSLASAEAYVENGTVSKTVQENTYTYDGDIFNYYDSYGNEPAFYDGNYNRQFDCYTEDGYVCSIESYMQYNAQHMYVAPVGFWKNEKRDAEILKGLKVG